MKKGFGVFFIVVGGLNIIAFLIAVVVFSETISEHVEKVIYQFVIALSLFSYGVWMYSSAIKESMGKNYLKKRTKRSKRK